MSFEPIQIATLDEPVRRFFGHAIAPGAGLAPAVALSMKGRVKADLWLPFHAEEEIDGRSFEWRGRVGLGPLTVLRIDDRFARGAGSSRVASSAAPSCSPPPTRTRPARVRAAPRWRA